MCENCTCTKQLDETIELSAELSAETNDYTKLDLLNSELNDNYASLGKIAYADCIRQDVRDTSTLITLNKIDKMEKAKAELLGI